MPIRRHRSPVADRRSCFSHSGKSCACHSYIRQAFLLEARRAVDVGLLNDAPYSIGGVQNWSSLANGTPTACRQPADFLVFPKSPFGGLSRLSGIGVALQPNPLDLDHCETHWRLSCLAEIHSIGQHEHNWPPLRKSQEFPCSTRG
jgi:hypothetical protein